MGTENEWELTKAGNKAARSVPNARRAIREFCEEFDMDWIELEEWPTLALQLIWANVHDVVFTPDTIRKALQELNKEWRESL